MLRILVAAVILVLSVSLAQAATCTVHVDDLEFGTVDAIGNSAATTTADVVINCDGITPNTDTITMCGNLGAGSGGVTGGLRRAVAGGNALGFVLYATSGSATPWGSITESGLGDPRQIDIVVGSGETSATKTVHLYGTVPSGQSSVPVGEYQASFGSSEAVFTYAEGDLNCSAPSGADAYASFAVHASIAANCLLETADLDFGTAGIIGSNIDAATDLGITCTPGTGYDITIDGGGSGDADHRELRSGSDTVSYGLYSDEARHDPWGTSPASTVSGSGNGSQQRLDVYGRIPPQQAVAGRYTDTVVVTILYE
jgi:spore coat protein U-like protein